MAPSAAAVLLLCFAFGDAHLHDEVASDSSEAAIQHGILSSSMQDYLNQISQLEIHNPTIAVPGEWLTDAKKSFVFLPIRIPKTLPLNDVKLLTDGKSLLVNVVELPQQAPEDQATKKFRFILDTFKEQAGTNTQALTAKLQEWHSDEDNSKVKDLIEQTLASMSGMKHHDSTMPRSLTIPLNTLELGTVREKIAAANHHAAKKADAKKEVQVQKFQGPRIANPHGGTATVRLRSTYLQQDATTKDAGYGDGSDGSGFGSEEPNLITIPLDSQFLQKLVTTADYVVPLNDAEAFSDAKGHDAHDEKAYIKESFSVRLPYPTPPGRIFAVLQSSSQLVLCMPYTKGSKANSSPFLRVPVFDMDGKKLLSSNSADLTPETAEKKKVVSAAALKTKPVKAEAPTPAKSAAPAPKKLIAIGL